MRLAYADPPYLGCCKLYDHEHNDGGSMPWDGLCWDDLSTHKALLDYLAANYDGWAYSMTSTSWQQIASIAPPARMASWQKSFAAFKRNVRIAYTWEPVLFVPGRDRSVDGAPVGRDHIRVPITMRKGFTGTKPPEVCRWILDLLGYVEGDTVDDPFPGLGVMAQVLSESVVA
jgi:hypothetical protein